MINSTADFNLDYTDDVLYIGYVKHECRDPGTGEECCGFRQKGR